MKRGPKPKPKALRILDGSRERPRHSQKPPEPSPGVPDAPPWLSSEAADEWSRIVPPLDSVGLLDLVDRGSLATLCQSWAEYVEATEHLRDEGTVVMRETANGSYPMLSPWVAVQEKAASRYNRMAGQFGLTPGARETLDLSKRETPLAKKSREEQLLG